MHVLAGFLCVLAALSGPAPAATDPFSSVLAREERGNFPEALKELRASAELLKAHQEHEAALVALLRTFDTVRTSLGKGQLDPARAALEALVPKLDPVRDAYLMHAAQERLVDLREQVRKMADDDLAKADQLADSGKYAEAIAVYSDVVESKAPEIPAAMKRRARQAMARTETAKAEAEEVGFWGKTWKSVSDGIFTLTGWSVFLAAGALLVWGARAWRKRWAPREETLIVLEDLTAQAAEREIRSQGLIREVLLRFGSMGKGESIAADIDALADIDGSAQANLRMEVDPVSEIPSVIQDGAPVQIGPFSMTPRQIVALVRAYFRRPWRSRVAGSLVQQDGHTLLLVERSLESDGKVQVDRWEARADGDDARAAVVQRMATRLAFELAKTKLTSDWRSFEACKEAMVHLARAERDEDRQGALEAACRDLQRSLRHDPANWIARFHLGATQRKMGQNESAAKHFEFLEKMAKDGVDPMAEFLENNPEFLFTLRYNRAVALSKIPSWQAHKEALKLLDKLVDDKPSLRLEMLARSARAAALTFEIENPPAAGPSPEDQARQREFEKKVFERIEQEKEWIETLPLRQAQADWKAYSLSFAAAQNAYGRACYRLGRGGGEEALRAALTMSPDFAESYITLAELFMRREPTGWTRQVEELLTRALEIAPSNQKAHYLLGKLYADDAVGDSARAKEHLAKAELLPNSYVVFARLLADEGYVADALKKMRRSIALSPEPDYRFELFIGYALQVLAKQKPPSPELLKEAKDVARKLAKVRKEKGEELLKVLEGIGKKEKDENRPPAPAKPDPAQPVVHELETASKEELPCAPTPENPSQP